MEFFSPIEEPFEQVAFAVTLVVVTWSQNGTYNFRNTKSSVVPVRKTEGYRTTTTVFPVMYSISDIKIIWEVISKKYVPLQSKGMVILEKVEKRFFKRSYLKFGYFTIRLNFSV